jgi:hypothetical protein
MCHFITAIIDKRINLDKLNELGQENIITFHTCDNDYVRNQLKETELYVAKNCKYCDCGTQLGMLTREQSPDPFRIEKREIDRLERKAWSDTKIKRWIADREKSIEKDRAKYDNLANGKHSDIQNWMMYFNKAVPDNQVNHIGLLLHWYKRGLENERIKIKERKIIKMSDLTEDNLLKMEEDVVYDIVR